MAARLYPPNIAGTLPSFYTDLDGTTKLVVPFSMNQSVSGAAVSGLSVKIKTTTTDTLIGIVRTPNWDQENFVVTFEFENGSDIIKKMVTGKFYKIQLAYYTQTNDTIIDGYYSTVSIVKYTEYPTVTIQGLESHAINSVNQTAFYGEYSNPDISEKVYQYRFIINRSYVDEITHKLITGLYLDSGWLIHDSSQDTSLSDSTDKFEITNVLSTGVNYMIQYQVITNNGLEISSAIYQMVSTANVGDLLPMVAHASLDYDNARMKITFDPLPTATEADKRFNGNYYILRTDSHTNLKDWIIIYSFQSFDEISKFIYYDYTIESGVAYKYAIQRINKANIFSQRVETARPIASYFEDCFLYDGKKQLKIRLNANVSSFKEVISETKKTTLGSKYPFVFRNGVLKYKEFPITGLLTYITDNDELFIPKSEILHPQLLNIRLRNMKENSKTERAVGKQVMSNEFIETTSQDDENVTAEKNFAMAALAWLNNGEIKLFKSSQEGNYIIKCLNVSLTPFNGTNRMIHSFSCTADEVQEYSPAVLMKYDILSTGNADEEGHTYIETTIPISITQVREIIYNTYVNADSLAERQRLTCNELANYDFSEGHPVTKISIVNGKRGQLFTWGKYNFGLDLNGSYFMEREEPYIGQLKLLPYTSGKTELLEASGTIYLTYRVDSSVEVESITKQKVLTYFGWSGYGHELAMDDNGQSRNLIQDFKSNKYIVSNSYKTVVHSYPIISRAQLYNTWNATSQDTKKLGMFYDKYITLLDTSTNKTYRLNKNNSTGGYELQEFTSNRNIRTKSETNNLVNINEYGSGGEDVVSINYLNPDEVYWTIGNDVYATFYYEVQQMEYSIESSDPDVVALKKAADQARETWLMQTFNFEKLNTQPTQQNAIVMIYNDGRFSQIAAKDWNNYANYNKYSVRSSAYSTSQITSSYLAYRTEEEKLERLIKNILTTQSGG